MIRFLCAKITDIGLDLLALFGNVNSPFSDAQCFSSSHFHVNTLFMFLCFYKLYTGGILSAHFLIISLSEYQYLPIYLFSQYEPNSKLIIILIATTTTITINTDGKLRLTTASVFFTSSVYVNLSLIHI